MITSVCYYSLYRQGFGAFGFVAVEACDAIRSVVFDDAFATVVYCVLLFVAAAIGAVCCCYFAKTIRNALSCDHIDFFCRIVSPPGVDDDVAHDVARDGDHGIVTQQQRCKL